MKRLGIFILAVLLLGALSAPAIAADPFNTYQWNRTSRQMGLELSPRLPWYEWWYYKVIDPQTGASFFFTYGVINPWDLKGEKKTSHSFVTFGTFVDKKILEEQLPVTAFKTSYEETYVQVGENVATDKSLKGKIQDAQGNVASWDIQFQKLWSANVMGWILPLAGLSNIYWYPAQGSAVMNGWIEYNGKKYILQNAPAYQDRNWGHSFPSWWAWLVSDQFKNSPGTVLLAGGGRPKVLNAVETIGGMNIVFRHKGKAYQFRKIDGNYMKSTINYGTWEIFSFNSFGESIRISAKADKSKFMTIPFATPSGALFYDRETLTGNIKVTLRKFGKLIADVETDMGGIEYGSFEKD